MPDASQRTSLSVTEGAVLEATIVRTALGATAKVRLFQSGMLMPTPSTPRSAYLAAEATFTGYAAVVVAAWDAVALESGGGAAFFTNGTSLFWQMTDTVAPNVIGGAWLEQVPAGPAVPAVLEYVIFDPPINLAAALQAINAEWKLRFPGPGEVSYSY